MDLLEQSKSLKREADQLIEESDIKNLLGEYGEVKIGGSYVLDAMVRRDLDFFVITKEHSFEKVKEMVSKLISQEYFHTVNFANYMKFKPGPKDGNLEGYYLGLYAWINGYEWKCDVWLITSDQDRTEETTYKFLKLLENQPEKRANILEIKTAMREGVAYVKGVKGRIIYEAVLEHGINTPEEFKEYLSKND